MAVITSIEPQKKKGRKNIFLDGVFWTGLSDFIIIKYNLKKGMSLDEDKIKKILFDEEYEKQIKYVNRLLSGSDRTIEELRQRLNKRKVPEDVISAVISKLEGYGLLSDEVYIKRFVENKKGYGYYYFIQRLKDKGIEYEKTKDVIDEILTQQEEKNRACEVLKKRKSNWKCLNKNSLFAKSFSFLKTRGFRNEAIYSAIKEVIKDTKEEFFE